MHILLLSETWGWCEDGGLSLLTKEMAKQLAKNEEVRVSCLVPETKKDQQNQAKEDGVDLVPARRMVGYTPLHCLGHPPDSVGYVDVVIGYGKDVGLHAQDIKDRYGSKWVHIALSSSEYETELCKESDVAFAVGRNVAVECARRLRFDEKEVHDFIPGIFSDLQMCKQAVVQLEPFCVIMFYPSAKERAEDEEIPAKTAGMLPAGEYELIVVCAPGDKPEEMKTILLQSGIPLKQLKVRSHCQDLASCCRMLLEADLLILPFLPSKSEHFGLITLLAISTDLPVLVSSSSGLGNALKVVNHGDLFVVDSDEPEKWKKRIMAVKEKDRSLRLREAREMHALYNKKYSWEGQCKTVLEKIGLLLKGLLYFHFFTYSAVCQ